LPLGLLSFAAVVMGIYTLGKAMASPTVEENRRWKRRYYKWMVSFLLMWAFMIILLKLRHTK